MALKERRLIPRSMEGLQQLCEHGDGEFVAAFNELLDIPGVWGRIYGIIRRQY